MQDNSTIVNFIRSIRANSLGAVVVAKSEPKLAKGTKKNPSASRVRFYDEERKEWNVVKVTTYGNVTFQRDYTASCENRSDNTEEYQTEKSKGKSHVEGCEGILLQSDKDAEKFYLRFSENANTTRKSVYFVNGRPATAEELEIIKGDLQVRSYVCPKQVAYGIDAEHQVMVKDIAVTNLIVIKCGAKVLNMVDEPMEMTA